MTRFLLARSGFVPRTEGSSRLPRTDDGPSYQSDHDGGCGSNASFVAPDQFAEAIHIARWPGENRLATQVTLNVRGQDARAFITTGSFFFQSLHDDPIEIAT